MKFSLLSVLLFFSTQTLADKPVETLQSAFKSNKLICAEGIKPKIKKGEVKISYPCEAIKEADQVETEKITFFENKTNPKEDDLIIRHRSSKKEKDFTLKFRKTSPGTEMEFDEELYNALKLKDDLKEVNFKCEADVTYGVKALKVSESCSLATPTDFFTPDHEAFMKMVKKTVPTNRNDLIPYEIQAVSWKVSATGFIKGVSVEKWLLKRPDGEELCMLELSGKFEVPKDSTLDITMKSAMDKLRELYPTLTPSSIQGNKTARALEFLKKASF